MHYGICDVCKTSGIVEEHHAIYRSQSTALRDCKLNLFKLDYECHRGTYGVHGKNGHDINMKIKEMIQERLFNELNEETYTLDKVAEILEVDEKLVRATCKTLSPTDGQAYETKEIVRKLQGGKLY